MARRNASHFKKLSSSEQVLQCPEMYIGSMVPVTEKTLVYHYATEKMAYKPITYTPGFIHVYFEALCNAADNKAYGTDTIEITFNKEEKQISIKNNGMGVPIEWIPNEKMWVPTLIFGVMCTSSQYGVTGKVVAGKNGLGIKVCNILANEFEVETVNFDQKLHEWPKVFFKQEWTRNMTEAGKPDVQEFKGDSEFTRVTYQPSLDRFQMTELDDDTIGLMSSRAVDMAAMGFKVFVNKFQIPVYNFEQYVALLTEEPVDDQPDQAASTCPLLQYVYEEDCGDKWEFAVAASTEGVFKHNSFVNGIRTTDGKHIEHVMKVVTPILSQVVEKKNKSGVDVKPAQLKNHVHLFLNCTIIDPSFDGQTKQNLTTKIKDFGSKFEIREPAKFAKILEKSKIVHDCVKWAQEEADKQLGKKQTAKKTSKVFGVPKLEDANWAGTDDSDQCTLIVTEGDSSITIAMTGVGSISGRDKFGVFPLKGKLMNIRGNTHNKIMENKEIGHLVKILGLNRSTIYTEDNMNTLRYRHLMIMTNQDKDGSHIKGLIINFIHEAHPELLKLGFLQEFITPIVKVTKGKQSQSFFSIPELEEWKGRTKNWQKYRLKYYKGLGTSTSEEAKEYFQNFDKHHIKFISSEEDDDWIKLAFGQKKEEKKRRKEWILKWMKAKKQRKIDNQPDDYLYKEHKREVTFKEFVKLELILFFVHSLYRAIPSIVDGFKIGQRKVIFTCLKRNDKHQVKVAQLAGAVGEQTAYHHGEASLMGTIINLAQDFVGSNNINLLQPIGQFGTRLAGGHDSAHARYIFTQLSPITKEIFNAEDDPLLKPLKENGKPIEPENYYPTIPMVLLNGIHGIGTGFKSEIPSFKPADIVKNLRLLIDGDEPEPMTPWFKGFKGEIEKKGDKYTTTGIIEKLPSETETETETVTETVICYVIMELPIGRGTQDYKIKVMEPFLEGAVITDFREHHTEKEVKFWVYMTPGQAEVAEATDDLHGFFKLKTSFSYNNLYLFDGIGDLHKYADDVEILKEFFRIRFRIYEKRLEYIKGELQAEIQDLENKVNFCEVFHTLKSHEKTKKEVVAVLRQLNFVPDPTKAFQAQRKAQRKRDEVAAPRGPRGPQGPCGRRARAVRDFTMAERMSE